MNRFKFKRNKPKILSNYNKKTKFAKLEIRKNTDTNKSVRLEVQTTNQ